MKKFKNIFLVLSFVFFSVFSVVLFSGEVSALSENFTITYDNMPSGVVGYECNMPKDCMDEFVIQQKILDASGDGREEAASVLSTCVDFCIGGWSCNSTPSLNILQYPVLANEPGGSCDEDALTCHEEGGYYDNGVCEGGTPAGGELTPEECTAAQGYMEGDICTCSEVEDLEVLIVDGKCTCTNGRDYDGMACIDPNICTDRAIDNTCTDPMKVPNDEACCVCAEPMFSKDGVCSVEEEDCIIGTVDAGRCNVEITEGGTLRSVIGVPLATAEPEEEIACGKGILIDGQSCCEGYKKFNEGGIKLCKECGVNGVCCGVKLSTVVPFIGDCIQFQKSSSDPDTTTVGPLSAFPKLMQGLSKIMVTAILVFSFVLLIVAGVMMTASGGSDKNYGKGKELIGKVIVGIALLGASGVILKLINPNFFG